MKFKTGDKIVLTNIPRWYGGLMKQGEVCTIIAMGYNSDVIHVRNADGKKASIYKEWASLLKSKNQQLLFEFMTQ